MELADSSTVDRATELIRCCRVPRINVNIADEALQRANFEHFLHVLEASLPVVFDLIANWGAALTGYDQYRADDNVQFKTDLALVITEQYNDGKPGELLEYQTESVALRQRINQFYQSAELEQLLTGSGGDRVLHRLYDHYRRVLTEQEWKHHPAAVAGFVRIVEFLYGPFPLTNPVELNDDTAAFILSVGVTLVEFFDPSYQRMGLQLFCVLLGPRHKLVMRRTNIHQVVYSNAIKLTAKCKQELFLDALWKCIYQYVELEESSFNDFSKWNTIDDIMETLLNGLMFESNLAASSIYLLYLLKLLAIDLPNYIIDELDELQSIDRKCHLYEPVCEQLRQDCLGGFHNRRYYRWVKRIIEMLPHEALKCQGNTRLHGKYCHGVHLLFILVTFPIEPEALKPVHIKIQSNLVEFLNVFKQYEKRQSMVASERSHVSNEFVYCLKGLVSISKTMLCFLTSLAGFYFPEHPDMATLGRQLANEYADCDSIMYNCMQSLIEKLR
ncbi:uncharacterized protein LOC125949326 isoform X1 [Anopheles darlingi]|uniref:uncharacterized protein LOC125949326 isoform X1 n=1 Tax=Anopheles darlingi TaxID=43151 RepID=UPI00210039ED|nr:uncharacterized protein LOC125949326 isoform X1 [Anopheles darlingi]